jgi:hypothetical protein
MNEQPEPAHLILAKVLIGQLPRRATTRCWVGPGHDLPCDGCDQTITSADVQHEVDAIGLGTLRFHARCMQLWEEASATPRDISGGSAPVPPTLVLVHGQRRTPVALETNPLRVSGWSGRAAALVGALWIGWVRLLSRPPVRQPSTGGGYAAVVVAVALTVSTVWIARAPRDVGTRAPSPPDRATAIRAVQPPQVTKPPSATPLARRAAGSPRARQVRSAPPKPRTPPPGHLTRAVHREGTTVPHRSWHAVRLATPSSVAAREVVHQAP